MKVKSQEDQYFWNLKFSDVMWKPAIHYSNLCIRFGTWWERRMNQPYLTHQFGSAHEWSGVWNGPDRCFCCFTVAMFMSLRRTQTWRLHTKLYKFGRHTSANKVRMKNSRDLNFGKVVYTSVIYRISDSWLFSWNGYDFYFDHMTGENRELNWKGVNRYTFWTLMPSSSETQGLLAEPMRYFRAKVNFKCWGAPGNLFLPNQFQKWSSSVPLIGQKNIFLPNQRGALAG